jgi:hypothetical protein
MKGYTLDAETRVVEECFALVYAPRRVRDRFPENCVQVVQSEAAALAGEDAARKLYAARVVGPARSSEGLRVFYLVRWLDAGRHG